MASCARASQDLTRARGDVTERLRRVLSLVLRRWERGLLTVFLRAVTAVLVVDMRNGMPGFACRYWHTLDLKHFKLNEHWQRT